jgi:hypothetical protein
MGQDSGQVFLHSVIRATATTHLLQKLHLHLHLYAEHTKVALSWRLAEIAIGCDFLLGAVFASKDSALGCPAHPRRSISACSPSRCMELGHGSADYNPLTLTFRDGSRTVHPNVASCCTSRQGAISPGSDPTRPKYTTEAVRQSTEEP